MEATESSPTLKMGLTTQDLSPCSTCKTRKPTAGNDKSPFSGHPAEAQLPTEQADHWKVELTLSLSLEKNATLRSSEALHASFYHFVIQSRLALSK